jgi:hypothetical protein
MVRVMETPPDNHENPRDAKRTFFTQRIVYREIL